MNAYGALPTSDDDRLRTTSSKGSPVFTKKCALWSGMRRRLPPGFMSSRVRALFTSLAANAL
ncbi:MAG: hypothetical protein EOO65_01355 [Methanosarcinales archaeon]|nr:MAG: hypothetical protein EOO65_01355 [Methanosarcinales archaeon]